MIRSALLLLCCLLYAPQAGWAAPTTQYLAGTNEFTFPGTKRVALTLLKRVLLPKKGMIIEYEYRKGVVPYVTTYRRIGQTSVFIVSDSVRTNIGTVTFVGKKPWQWKRWKANLVFLKHRVVVGEVTMDTNGQHSRSVAYTKRGKVSWRNSQKLLFVTKAAFTKKFAKHFPELLKPILSIPLRVKVMDAKGKGVKGAVIRDNGKYIGKTDAKGSFVGSLKRRVNELAILSVKAKGRSIPKTFTITERLFVHQIGAQTSILISFVFRP